MNTNETANNPSEIKETLKSNESTKEQQEEGFFGSWKSALLLAIIGFIRAAMTGFEDFSGVLFFLLGIGWLLLALFSSTKQKTEIELTSNEKVKGKQKYKEGTVVKQLEDGRTFEIHSSLKKGYTIGDSVTINGKTPKDGTYSFGWMDTLKVENGKLKSL